jgi:hypothetical protein
MAENNSRRNYECDPLEVKPPLLAFQQEADGSINWFVQEIGQYGQALGSWRPTEPLDRMWDAKVYNFADALKDVCVNVLGLKPEQCYGSDAEKNSLVPHILWDNMPEAIRRTGTPMCLSVNFVQEMFCRCTTNGGEKCEECLASARSRDESRRIVAEHNASIRYRTGPMTGREVMQVFGTDIMRKAFFDGVWVNATLSKIRSEKIKLALIGDMRFRSEFAAMYDAGAYVIRLERNVTKQTHASEVDFDGFNFKGHSRCLVIPADTDLPQKNRIALDWLTAQGVFGDI